MDVRDITHCLTLMSDESLITWVPSSRWLLVNIIVDDTLKYWKRKLIIFHYPKQQPKLEIYSVERDLHVEKEYDTSITNAERSICCDKRLNIFLSGWT